MDDSGGNFDDIPPIRLLPEATINRIAAGEILQRPSNAVKELIENSLDSGSTSVKVTIRDGGIKSMVIVDNGHGIPRDDLSLLCQRHTTSKISHFNDLASISTFGFRGEALASISHVSRMSVLTKTKKDNNGWKASYSDGALIPLKPGDEAIPRPSAANNGTTITIQDLFYNVPQRRKALRSSSEEYARIYDVIARYAIKNSGVAFVLRKGDTAIPDISTQPTATILDNIALIFSDAIRRDLEYIETENESLSFKAQGYVSKPSFSSRKPTFIFFINNRLVDCMVLRKAIDSFYSNFLAKGAHPFVYLSLDIAPDKMDVNVHPTKREVHFLDEEEIVQAICNYLEGKLSHADQSRTYMVQTFLPGAGTTSAENDTSISIHKTKIAPNKLVRTDHSARTLDAMFGFQAPSSFRTLSSEAGVDESSSENSIALDNTTAKETGEPLLDKRRFVEETRSTSTTPIRTTSASTSSFNPVASIDRRSNDTSKIRSKIVKTPTSLSSINELRRIVTAQKHHELGHIIKNHTFVGIIDLHQNLSLVQHMTKLYMVNHSSLCEEMFYQLGLRQFAGLRKFKLQPAPSVKELLTLAVEAAPDVHKAPISPSEIVKRIFDNLYDRRDMMDEYFSLKIDEQGYMSHLPILLPDYFPNIDKLPLLLLRLGTEVNWDEEKPCFDSILREMAFFYSPYLPPGYNDILASDEKNNPTSDTGEISSSNQPETTTDSEVKIHNNKSSEEMDRLKWTISHILFPAMKQLLEPPITLSEKDVVQIANLQSLYRVFERC